jgi:hypothetical protein
MVRIDAHGDGVRVLLRTSHGITLLIIVLIGIGFSVMPILNTFRKPDSNKDYTRWWLVARAVDDGTPIYPPGEIVVRGFIYPPGIASVVYAPLSILGFTAMVAALCLINMAAHAFSIMACVHFATGRWRDQHLVLYLVPLLVTLPYVWDTYFLGQLNLTLLAVMLLGFVMLDRGRPGAAGGLFAFAASTKVFPVMVLGYLVWRRRWAAAAATVVGIVVFMLVAPMPMRGVERHLQESREWLDRVVLSTSSTSIAGIPGRAYRAGNQSLVSVVNRLTRPVEETDPPPSNPDYFNVNLVDIGPRGSFLVFGTIAGVLCLAYILAMPRAAARTPRIAGIEYAILLILITIFSPKAGSYYFCWTMPGLAVITAAILSAPAASRARRLLVAGLIVTVAIMATALAQAFDRHTPQTYGSTLWGAVALLGMLLLLLWGSRHWSLAASPFPMGPAPLPA